MRATASLEPIAAILRFHPDGGDFGAPYSGSATVTFDGSVAELRGLSLQGGAFTRGHGRAIGRALAEAGVTEVVFDRRRDGRWRRVRLAIAAIVR